MRDSFVDLLEDYLDKKETYENIKRVATDSKMYANAYDVMQDAREELNAYMANLEEKLKGKINGSD